MLRFFNHNTGYYKCRLIFMWYLLIDRCLLNYQNTSLGFISLMLIYKLSIFLNLYHIILSIKSKKEDIIIVLFHFLCLLYSISNKQYMISPYYEILRFYFLDIIFFYTPLHLITLEILSILTVGMFDITTMFLFPGIYR